MPVLRRVTGRISYRHRVRGETGREWFDMTMQRDGARTLRATCEMDEEQILRDVVHTVDAQWRPVDAFVRLHAAGRFCGASLFRFGEEVIECDADLADLGHVRQRLSVPSRPDVFACHPLSADGWQAGAANRDGSVGKRRILSAHCSPEADGGSGPLAGVNGKTIEFVGEEEVAVPAGDFHCRTYLIHPDRADWAPLRISVVGEDNVLVRLDWDVLDSQYLLTELHIHPT